MEEGLPHSEEAARLAGELLAALAEATASDSTFGVGDVGCLLLALLASDQSALHAEDEEGSTEQAERLFRSARTALDACCAARAAREEGWPLPGFPQLTAWLEARAADSLKRPFDWIEAYVEQKTAAGVQTGQMADGPQPAGTQPASQQLDSSGSSGSSGSSACSGAGASGGSSGAEDAQPSDSDSIAAAVALGSQLACIGMQALEALAVATSRATDLRALAAGMEAVAWLLVLRPPGFWPPDVLRGTWELLVHACRALGPKGAATGGAASSSGSGSGSGVGGRQAAGKRRSQAARQGGTAATNQQTAEAHSKEVAQQRGDWAFHSVAASWTLLLTWRVDLRGQLFPPAVVVERAALMLRVEGHTMQRMRAAYLLAAARPWLSAAAANQQMLLSHAPRQLIASLSWALDLKRLRVLGLTGESERFLRTRLLCLSHDVLRDVAQTAGTASCAAELPRCLQMVASIVRDTAELLPPACETAEQLRERAVELAETCGPEGGRTTTPGTPQELLGRCCLYFAALTTVLPGQALADERMLRALTDVMWRCPAPDLLDAAGTACWGLFDQFGRDTPLTFPMEVLDRVGAVLIAVLDGFGVFMQRLPAQERPRMYGVCRSVLSTFHNIRFEAETGAKAVAVVCRTIRKLARLPGMQPPLQLWLLLCAAEEMTHTGHPAREALDAEDIGVETCMAMVASLRMVAEQPHNFSGGEHTWQAQLASDAAFHVYLNTWAWPGLLEQLHQKNAPAALLRALCQPGLPADLSCRAVMSCLAVLARMDDHPDVLVKVIRSGLVHKLLVPQLRLVVDGFARTQVADRDFHGVAAVRLACSVLNIAWQPHLRQELGIGYAGTNGKESSTNGTEGCGGRQGCGGKQGGTNGKQGGGSPGKEAVPGGCGVDTCTCSAEAGECPCGSACCCGHEPFTVPDTSKLGFCWTELYELILEAMLMLWGTAVHEECEWSGHWVREMASVSVDGLGLLSACEPRIWVPFLSKRMIHRLADIGRLAKCSLHEVNVFGRSHFAKHGSGCVSCIVSFARVAESVVSLVQQCEGRPTLTLCLARQGLPSELRATAGIIERHFQEDEKFQELRASCLSMADSLAACEAKHPPPNSQQLRQLRRRLLDTLCDPELAASILQGGEGEQHEEEAEGEQLDEAAAAEQAAAALLQEEEAAEQRQQQQVRKKAKAAAKQRQAAAVADARRRQQQEAQEARRRQAEEEKAQRERQRRAAAEQTRRQREEEEAAAAERLRAEARKGAAEEAARQAAAEQERRQRAEAAAALAAARQAALDEASCPEGYHTAIAAAAAAAAAQQQKMKAAHVLLLLLATMAAFAPGARAGLLSAFAGYGACQTACNVAWVSCYAGTGLIAGTVTAGLGAPEMALACNAAQGLCMTACAGGLLLSPTP
ncbi:cell envelope integrity [Chlorella sorokiniana]|uniref:Cell envelope integrity n=1 Tax=Chlorella sorokiniana TaxID=3076 RepID=A0A2P6TFC2_CHLSO|nr:cell envelope integrity [Chlorella sorokiniana]|eukprot:PRW32660.1 cell envelope integrity [Chlorella sorokiniana]